MKCFIKIAFSLFFLVSFHTPLFAQVKFTATITPTTIGKDETAELRFTVDNASQVDAIKPPVLNDFTIVSGPNQETSMESINGVTTQSTAISYLIQPKAVGNFTIAPATAKLNGKVLQSNSLTVKVVKGSTGNGVQNNAAQSPFAGFPGFQGFPGMGDPIPENDYSDNILKKGENIQDKINKNLFLRAEPNKTSAFVGEPIIVSYNIYTRLDVQSNISKTPAFDGFSMIPISDPRNVNTTERIVKLDGREYHVFTLMKVQLYPLQPGQFSLGTVNTDNTIHFVTENGIQDQQVSLKNKPVIITVKALPEKDKPVSFKGAVGNFTLTASLAKDSFATSDAGKLSIVIAGGGNMTLINAPLIHWPDGIESFEPKHTENLNKTQVPITGIKEYDYNFTATDTGNYTIPSIAFSFFDPKTASYQTVTTQPLMVTVTKGSGNTATPAGIQWANTNKSFFSKLESIPLLPFELTGLIVLLGLFFWFNRTKKSTDAPIAISPVKEIKVAEPEQSTNHLALSEEKLLSHDSKGFYNALNKEMRAFLSAYFHILPEAVNKKRISEELDKKGVSIGVSIKLQQLMDDIERQLYSPVHADAQLEESFSNAKEMIYSLESIAR